MPARRDDRRPHAHETDRQTALGVTRCRYNTVDRHREGLRKRRATTDRGRRVWSPRPAAAASCVGVVVAPFGREEMMRLPTCSCRNASGANGISKDVFSEAQTPTDQPTDVAAAAVSAATAAAIQSTVQ